MAKETKRRRQKGTGRIVERPKGSGHWLCVIDLGTDGKRDLRSKTIVGSRKDAEDYLTKLKDLHNDGLAARGSADSLGVYLDSWLAAKSHRRRNTRESYRNIVENHIRPALGKLILKKISSDDIQDFYQTMKKDGRAGMIRPTHMVLSMVFGKAHRTAMIPRNPTRDKDIITLPEKPHRERECFSAEQAYRFLNMVKAYRNGQRCLASP